MKRVILFFGLLVPLAVYGNAYVANVTPTGVYGATGIYFGVDNPPSDTCTYFQRQFKFSAADDAGKNMFSILLAARMAGENVDIWYSASSAAGTNSGTGCSPNTMATVISIGISD